MSRRARREVVIPRDVGRVLDMALEEDPDRCALVGRDRRLSYAALDAEADAAAAALASFGVGTGDRVAVSQPNDTEVVVAFHGAMRLGAVWVGLNQALPASEKAALVADCGARALICDERTAHELRGLRVQPPELRSIRVAVGGADPGPSAGTSTPPQPLGGSSSALRWKTLVDACRGRAAPGGRVDPDAPAAIAYTSGTTGRPKGVLHSQSGLLVPGAALVATRNYGPQTVKADCLALTILNLQVLSTLLVAQARGTCVVMDARDATGIARWIHDERVTVWNGVPTMLYDLVHDDTVLPDALASLEDVWSGGAPCPEGLREAFTAKFGHRVHTTYGLTEAPTVVAIEPVATPSPPGSSGRVLPHLAVRILDDEGVEVAPAATGEICLGPPTDPAWRAAYRPLVGYWGQEPRDVAEWDDVVHTGDLGSLGVDGQLYVRDRKQLLILRGGANVYPAEVEAVLLSVPGVRGAAAFGVPDERLGERVMAVVEVEEGYAAGEGDPEAALRRYCAEHLPRYKVPDRIVLRATLPRNAMGKVQRDRLTAMVQ